MFCEIPHPVLGGCENSLPPSGTCLQGVFKDRLCRQFLCRTAMLCNLGDHTPFGETTRPLSSATGVHECMTHRFF